jgi:hypothetical protein
MASGDIQLVDLDSYEPSDGEVLSFMQLLCAPDQLEWNYDVSWVKEGWSLAGPNPVWPVVVIG